MQQNFALLAGIALVGFCGFGLPARGEFIATLEQQGSNVVWTGSGTIDRTDLTFDQTFTEPGTNLLIDPSIAEIQIGDSAGATLDFYKSISGPTNFGSGGATGATSGSGDWITLSDSAILNGLSVPHGYTSGTQLSNSAIWDNATFSSLGVTPGTYTWTWGSGAHADSFELDIGGSVSVPEPASLVLLGTALLGFGVIRRRRRGLPREAFRRAVGEPIGF